MLGQTYDNIEVVIACHGPNHQLYRVPAGTGWQLGYLGRSGFLEGKMINDYRIRIVDVPRRPTYPDTPINHWLAGPVEPLNAALAVARGQWLARIDDDDEWAPSHLTEMLRFAKDRDYEFVSSAYKQVDNSGNWYVIDNDGGSPPIGGTQTWLWRSYLRFMKWNGQCWRKRWDAVNDTDLAQRMRDARVRIGHTNYIGTTVRARPGEKVGSAAYLEDPVATHEKFKFH